MSDLKPRLRAWIKNPAVYLDGRFLIAETMILKKLVCLGAYSRRLIVDPVLEEIRLRSRTFGARRTVLRIPFFRIVRLHRDYGPGIDIGLLGPKTEEYISVSLILEDEIKVTLVRFDGEYTSVKDRFTRFTNELRRITGKPLGKPPSELAPDWAGRMRCGACGLPSPPNRDDCVYCGGSLTQESPPSD